MTKKKGRGEKMATTSKKNNPSIKGSTHSIDELNLYLDQAISLSAEIDAINQNVDRTKTKSNGNDPIFTPYHITQNTTNISLIQTELDQLKQITKSLKQ
ncbi:MAG: hypothetical protein HRT90_08950 [Candidatus Margulisbacteria bacterium]|nr:hypothetical protein [Candidatus Margulisiibacteriota bacterium]